jgi:hypothetical protein
MEDAGALMFSRTMFVQAATTEVIWAYSVAVQEAGADPTATVVAATEATEVGAGAADEVADEEAAEATLDAATFEEEAFVNVEVALGEDEEVETFN